MTLAPAWIVPPHYRNKISRNHSEFIQKRECNFEVLFSLASSSSLFKVPNIFIAVVVVLIVIIIVISIAIVTTFVILLLLLSLLSITKVIYCFISKGKRDYCSYDGKRPKISGISHVKNNLS